jgi:hypothetical protein
MILASLAVGCTIRDQERKYRSFFYQSAEELVPGFHLPDEAQYGPLWAFVEGPGWETRDGSGETKAEFWTSGEFNGDNTIDFAYILAEQSSDTRALFAFLSTASGYEAIQLDSGFPWGIWLKTRAPGRYETAAARGAGPDSPDAVLAFESRNQTIDFFQFEGAESTFVWNETTQSFDRFRISD